MSNKDNKEPEEDPSATEATGYKHFVIDSPPQKKEEYSQPRISSPDNDEFNLNDKKSSSELNPTAV